jgi:regulator of protease activity HflC (stomatin/prohibitin superfamily)
MLLSLIFFVVLLILDLISSMRVANQYESPVVFRLGKYAGTMGSGLYR